MWTPWFIRFAFERGWYSLYTNFPNKKAFAISYREAGLNFNRTWGPMNSLVTKLEPSLHFNFTSKLPIFDFHFANIEQAALLAFRSSLWHPTHFVNQCYVDGSIANVPIAPTANAPPSTQQYETLVGPNLSNLSINLS
ncbi:unnamed protein product, partial [Rotaria sp. Silwood2]